MALTAADAQTLYWQAFMEAAASPGFVMATDRYAGLVGIASQERAPLLLPGTRDNVHSLNAM